MRCRSLALVLFGLAAWGLAATPAAALPEGPWLGRKELLGLIAQGSWAVTAKPGSFYLLTWHPPRQASDAVCLHEAGADQVKCPYRGRFSFVGDDWLCLKSLYEWRRFTGTSCFRVKVTPRGFEGWNMGQRVFRFTVQRPFTHQEKPTARGS